MTGRNDALEVTPDPIGGSRGFSVMGDLIKGVSEGSVKFIVWLPITALLEVLTELFRAKTGNLPVVLNGSFPPAGV